jgi:outer membrane protein, heavy metal efflux system
MIDETPKQASRSCCGTVIRPAVIITLLIAACLSQRMTDAATLAQSLAPKNLQADQQDAQSAQGEHAGHQTQTTQSAQSVPQGAALTLAELERLATQNNPTLGQAEAAIRSAQGRRRQAGLWPNPIIGYRGEEFAFRAFSQKSEHFGFIEQEVLLGGKLRKSQRIFEQEILQAESEATAQKQRVLNTVRMLYYEALGAQQRADLRSELARIAREAVKTTSELQNVGQADRPDYLESEVEAQQVELELINAQNEYDEVWRLLASAVGQPELKPARLDGDLEAGLPKLDQEALTITLLNESPEIKSARAEVERARAVIARAKAERVPDLILRGAFGYSTELLETRTGPGGKTGPEASIEIGFRVPLFNRNQGGISAAEAELMRAERDLQRLQLVLRVRLAQAFRDYNNASSAVQRYKETILPRTERAYNLYLASFRQMAASYPQVLISQRTMFQVRENYLDALVNLRQSTIQIEGLLLTGGLDTPRVRSEEGAGERVEMTGARSGSQGSLNHSEKRER